jgi:3-hydroxybutyryl-CoA dehydratase
LRFKGANGFCAPFRGAFPASGRRVFPHEDQGEEGTGISQVYVKSVGMARSGWTTSGRGVSSMNDLNGYDIEDLSVGMSATFGKTITEADMGLFAGISGDINALHINEEYAAGTPFGGRVVHGILTTGLISATIANKLPGPGAIYMEQNIRFLAPVRPGDTVHATVTVKEVIARRGHVILETVCRVGATEVISGEAKVKVGSFKKREEKKKLALAGA